MTRSRQLLFWRSSADDFGSIDRSELDYAWNWFTFHAKQREQVFYFFLIAVPFLANAFALLLEDGRFLAAATVAVSGSLASCGFLILDKRNRRLTHWAEDILYKIENAKLFKNWGDRYEVRDEKTVYRGIRYREEQELTDERAVGRYVGYLRFWTPVVRHSFVFQFLQSLAGVGFAVAAGYVIYDGRIPSKDFWIWFSVILLATVVLVVLTYCSTCSSPKNPGERQHEPPKILGRADIVAILLLVALAIVTSPVGQIYGQYWPPSPKSVVNGTTKLEKSVEEFGIALNREIRSFGTIAITDREQTKAIRDLMSGLDRLKKRLNSITNTVTRRSDIEAIQKDIESFRSRLTAIELDRGEGPEGR